MLNPSTAFRNVKKTGAGWLARCPAHDDHHASLSIGLGDTGKVLLKCHAGCDLDDILAAAHLEPGDLFPEEATTTTTIVATYRYVSEVGVDLYDVVRFAPKDFRQRRADGTWSMRGVRRVLYHLDQLQGQTIAYVVEGEKDADRLRAIGLPGTTHAGGAGKWQPAYVEQLQAATVEHVVILPDHDEPGRKHGEDVARNCHAAGLAVKIVYLPDLPEKGDVSDWLDAGHTKADLVALVKAAARYTPTATDAAQSGTAAAGHVVKGAADDLVRPVLVRLADVRPEAVTWLWPGRLAAGKLTLLVGDPGLGKSWITLDIAARVSAGRGWPDGGPATDPANALLLSAEDGLADTIRPRLDALGADVTRVHHLAVLRCREQERAIQLADTTMLERAIGETGARVLVIDPVSAYLGTTDSHRDAEVRALMAPLAAVAERTGAAVLGVMHLCKGTQRPAIYRAVGSIAFAASARIVLAVAADPEHDGRRILAGVKSNLSAAPAALAYVLTNGRLTWDAAPVSDVDVEALLSGPMSPRDRGEQTDAEQVIRELLEDEAAWPLSAQEALDAGRQQGIPERTLRWTARRLGIRIDRAGFGARGKWLWHRPSIAAGLAPMDDDTEKPQSISIAAYRGKESASCRYVAPMENIKENERFPASDAHSGKGHCDDDVL